MYRLAMHKVFVRQNLRHFEKSLPYSDESFLSWWAIFRPAGAWIGLLFCLLTVAVFSSVSWSDRGESTTSILAAWTVVSNLVPPEYTNVYYRPSLTLNSRFF